MKKRTLYRVLALGCIVLLSIFLFWIGKGHTLLLDNKDVTIDGKSYAALNSLRVTINKQEPVALRSGMRKLPKNMVAGPWHTIKVEVLDNKEVIKIVEKKFSLPLKDMFILNIPALLEDEPLWVQEFISNT